MGKTRYVKMKLIPLNMADLDMVKDAMRQERQLKNALISRYAIKYFEHGMDLKATENDLREETNFGNPYIKAFSNPMLDKALCVAWTRIDLKKAHHLGLKTGDSSLPSYRSSNLLLVKSEQLKLSNKYGDEIETKYKDRDFDVILLNDKTPFGPKTYYRIVFGNPKRSLSLRTTIKNIILGKEKRVGTSRLMLKNDTLYLIMTLANEPPEIRRSTGIVVGVDIGVSVPAACAINKNDFERCFIGDARTIAMQRKRAEYRCKALTHQLKTARGGHGKKRKFESIEQVDMTVQGFMKTYNHRIASEIIKFAVSHNAFQINLEKLEFHTGDSEYTNRLLQVMEYNQLQRYIEEKANSVGIAVKYVNPANTSRTCSRCGFASKENRPSQKVFCCVKCGYKANADFNAARNISRAASD